MFFFRKNIISNQVVKSKADKLSKRILKDVNKKIKKGELIDSYSLELYLSTIDNAYSHLKADITSANRVFDYAGVRGKKIAETRKLLGFFSQDQAELERLSHITAKKAAEAGRTDDFQHEKLSFIDVAKLRQSFDDLVKKGERI